MARWKRQCCAAFLTRVTALDTYLLPIDSDRWLLPQSISPWRAREIECVSRYGDQQSCSRCRQLALGIAAASVVESSNALGDPGASGGIVRSSMTTLALLWAEDSRIVDGRHAQQGRL